MLVKLLSIFLFFLNILHAVDCNSRVPSANFGDPGPWTLRTSGVTVQLLTIAYGNGVIIVGGVNGGVTTSTDGVNWTQRSTGYSGNMYGGTFGKGIFLFANNGFGIIQSVDGVTWTHTGYTTSFYTIAFGNGLFIGGTTSSIYRSTDGFSWTTIHSVSSFWVVYGNGLFVSCGNTGAVATSADGTTWTTRTSGTTQRLNALDYGNELYVIVGYSGAIITSPNGITWTTRSSGTTVNLWGVAYGSGMFVVGNLNGVMYQSMDGITWTPFESSPSPLNLSPSITMCNKLKYIEDLGMFIVVGDTGKIYTMNYAVADWPCGEATDTDLNRCYVNTGRNVSSNASTETACALACSNEAYYEANSSTGVCQLKECEERPYGASANESEPCGPGECIWDQGHATNAPECINATTNCSDQNNYKKNPLNRTCFLYPCHIRVPSASGDLGTWALRTSGVSMQLLTIAYGNGVIVVGGVSGGITTSTDGVNWTQRNTGYNGNMYGVTYGNGIFLVSCTTTGIIRSVDGVTWTHTGFTTYFYTIAYGKEVFVGGFSNIYKSTDGLTWTTVHTISSLYIFYGNGMFVSCGTTGAVATSADGTAWTNRTSGTTQRLNAIEYGNEVYVSIGYSGTIITSPNGITWTTRSSGTTVNLWGVAFGNGMFVVGDLNGVMYKSTDGITWMLLGTSPSPLNLSPAITMCNKLAYVEDLGMFIVVGDTGKIYTIHYPGRWRCKDPTDLDGYQCYENTGRNDSSNASTETVCALVCSNSGHYGANTNTGVCTLRDCEDRSKNASESEPCGPGFCYWDQGHPSNTSRCIDEDTNCSNADQYAKEPLNYTCVPDVCEMRQPNENMEKKCGAGQCYVQPGDTCNVSCPDGLYPNNRGVCVCPLEHFVSEMPPCVYIAGCEERSFYPDTPLPCGESCFYGTNGLCLSNCLEFQTTSASNECSWLDCDERLAISPNTSVSSTSVTLSASSSPPTFPTYTSSLLSPHRPSVSNPIAAPSLTCWVGTDGDPVPMCHYMADYASYSANVPPLTPCTLECPDNYETLTGPYGTYCSRISCTARNSTFGCTLPAETANSSCFLNLTNDVCVETCPLHAEPDEDNECQQLDCTGRAAVDVGTALVGSVVFSCSHPEDDYPCVWFADHGDERFLEEIGGVWRERHTECLSQCPHNYERVSDDVGGHTRYYCSAKACETRTSETDCTLPGDDPVHPCHVLNERCHSSCPFHTTPSTTLDIPECIPDPCSTRQPNTGGDGLCRIHAGDECFRVSESLCAPHCGAHSIADEPSDGICVYANCSARSLQSDTCRAAGDPIDTAHSCLHFPDYASAPFNSSVGIAAGFDKVCQLAQCPPNYDIDSSGYACERVACPDRTDANGCYLPGDGTAAASMIVCRSFPDADLYGDAFSGAKCVDECPPNYNSVITSDPLRLITVHTCQPIIDCASRTASPNCSLIIFGDSSICRVFADSPFFVDGLGNEKTGYTNCVRTCPLNYVEATDNSTYPYPPKYYCGRQEQCALRIPVNENCTLPGDTIGSRCYYNPVTQMCDGICSENYAGSEETLPNGTIRYTCKPVDCLDRNVSGGCALPGDEEGIVPKCFIPPVASIPSPSLSSSFSLSPSPKNPYTYPHTHTGMGISADAISNTDDDTTGENETGIDGVPTCVLTCPPFSSLATTPSATAAGQCVYSACGKRAASETLGCGTDTPTCYFFPDFTTQSIPQCGLDCPPNYMKGTEIDDSTGTPLTKYVCERQGQCDLRIPANQNCSLSGDTVSAPCYYNPATQSCVNSCSGNFAGIQETLPDYTIRFVCRAVACLDRNASSCALPGDGTGDIPKCYTPVNGSKCVLDCPEHTEKDEGARACMSLNCPQRRPVSIGSGRMSCGTDEPHCFFVEGQNTTGCSLGCSDANYEESTEYGNPMDAEELTGYFCKARVCQERTPPCHLPIDSESSETYPLCFTDMIGIGCSTACLDFQVANPITYVCGWADCSQRTPRADGTCGNDSMCYHFNDTNAPGWIGYLPCNIDCPPNYRKESKWEHNELLGYVCTAVSCSERNATSGCSLPVDGILLPTCYTVPATYSSEGSCSTDCEAFQEPTAENVCAWKKCEDRVPIADPLFNTEVEYTCGVSTNVTPTCVYLPHSEGSTSNSACVSACPTNYEVTRVDSSGGNKLYCKPLPCERRNYTSGCKVPGDGSEQPACYTSPATLGCVSECPSFTSPGGANGITCTTLTCASRSAIMVDDGTGSSIPVCGSEQPPCFYISGNDSCGTSCPQDYGPVERASSNHQLIGYSCVSATGYDGANSKSKSSNSNTWIVPVVIIFGIIIVTVVVGFVVGFIFFYKKLDIKNNPSQKHSNFERGSSSSPSSSTSTSGAGSGSVSKERRDRELEALEGKVQIRDHLNDDDSVSLDSDDTTTKHPVDELMEEEEVEEDIEEEEEDGDMN